MTSGNKRQDKSLRMSEESRSVKTVASSYVSQDEMEFLARTGALDKMRGEEHRGGRGKSKIDDEPPGFPVKTMIAVLVILIIVTISAWTTMQNLEPYANIASDENFTALMDLMGSASSGSSGTTDADLTEQAKTAASLYSYKWTLIAGIVGLGIFIEFIILIVWRIRSNKWYARMALEEG